MDARPAAAEPPSALTVALVIVAIEAAAEIVYVLRTSVYGPGGQGLLILALGGKVALAWRTRQLDPIAAVGLVLFQSVGLLAALAVDWAVWLRLGLAASVVAVIALVGTSLHAFPTPELPR